MILLAGCVKNGKVCLKCDENKSRISDFFVFFAQDFILANTPCGADYNLKPGDSFKIVAGSGARVKGCSENSWVLKVVPPVEGIVRVDIDSPPCKNTIQYIQESAPGAVVEIKGISGCLAGDNNKTLDITAKGPSGSEFQISFD